MKKFLALYHTIGGHQAPPPMTPAEQEAMMAPWGVWKAKYGDQIVDLGAPCMPATKSADGNAWSGSTGVVSGYSIVSAKDIDAAKEMFKGHPIYNYPNHTIEISECAGM